jgi:hypothetical protein
MWCFIIPYSVSTGVDEGDVMFLFIFSLIVDIAFWADLVFSFFTSYPDANTGKPITCRKSIIKHYLLGWFLIDFVSVFPFEPIIKAAMAGNGGMVKDDIANITSIGKTARLARVSKIFRLVRFLKVLL